MFEINDYLYFPDGSCEIGIDSAEVDGIVSMIDGRKIKKEFISASSPVIKIKYNNFYIKKKLITTEEFKKFIQVTSYVTEAEKDGWGWVWNNNKWQKEINVSWKKPFIGENIDYNSIYDENFPVMQVTWNDAAEYTKWLSLETGETVRLPYEYEWEILGNYAGLPTMKSLFSDNNSKIKSDIDFVETLKYNIENSEYQLGLLWEWTMNWYDGYDISVSNKDFGRVYKTLRGGSLLSENIQKSKEFRFRRCPTARSPYYGFRIVFEQII
jgi:formylglycine-generating enzyme required for sulfatase activity